MPIYSWLSFVINEQVTFIVLYIKMKNLLKKDAKNVIHICLWLTAKIKVNVTQI